MRDHDWIAGLRKAQAMLNEVKNESRKVTGERTDSQKRRDSTTHTAASDTRSEGQDKLQELPRSLHPQQRRATLTRDLLADDEGLRRG